MYFSLSFEIHNDRLDDTVILTQGDNVLRIYPDQAWVLLNVWPSIARVVQDATLDRRGSYSTLLPNNMMATVSELKPYLLLQKFYWDTVGCTICERRTIIVQLEELTHVESALIDI